jgi:hypothetical protein
MRRGRAADRRCTARRCCPETTTTPCEYSLLSQAVLLHFVAQFTGGSRCIMLTLNWYAMLGALDDAYETAQRMLATFARTGVLNSVNLPPLWLPELRAFRLDPRFGDFAASLGLIDYWKQRRPPDSCELRDGRLIFQ